MNQYIELIDRISIIQAALDRVSVDLAEPLGDHMYQLKLVRDYAEDALHQLGSDYSFGIIEEKQEASI